MKLVSVLIVLGIICGMCKGEFPDSPYTRSCNGQGIVYSDSDYSVCECFDCFHGQFCENENENCIVNVAGGGYFFWNLLNAF